MIQLRSDQETSHSVPSPSWSHCMEKTQGGLISFEKLKKRFWEKLPVNCFIIFILLLTFCKPIKNFEDLNLDNINILYNFTRQKEGSLKFELGSPFVHNLYRMVSSMYSLLSQLSTCYFQGVHGYQASHRSSGIGQSFGSQGGESQRYDNSSFFSYKKFQCHYPDRGPCASYDKGSKDNSPLHPEDQPKHQELWGAAGVSCVPGFLQRLQHLLSPPSGQVMCAAAQGGQDGVEHLTVYIRP